MHQSRICANNGAKNKNKNKIKRRRLQCYEEVSELETKVGGDKWYDMGLDSMDWMHYAYIFWL